MKKFWSNHKKSLLWFIIGIITIFVTSLTGSLLQNKGGQISVSDLRDATNTGTITLNAKVTEDEEEKIVQGTATVKGEVKSGILFVPKQASKENKLPGIVLTHGYLNNRELQLPFAIELARRGFVVLTVDREGHGNYENRGNQNAMMATSGLYESAKYLYNLDFVDQSKIGITGHSMGGYTTAMALMEDFITPNDVVLENGAKAKSVAGLNIIKAGLIQGWSTFITASPNTSVGILKAKDDEFFFNSKDENDNPTISREYLHSQDAAKFVKVPFVKGQKIDIQNGKHYVDGQIEENELGTQVSKPFRVVYEADEIHPLNHWSIPSTGYVIDFFYSAFGTPSIQGVIGTGNQIWRIKEIFSFIGMLSLLSLIFPAVSLLLAAPFFRSLRTRTNKVVNEVGTIRLVNEEVTDETISRNDTTLKKWYDYLIYLLPAFVCTFFSGFVIQWFVTDLGDRWFPNTQLYPQDTTNWVALWSLVCGLFAFAVIFVVYESRKATSFFLNKKGIETEEIHSPFDVLHISSVKNVAKTILLALIVVVGLFAIVFINWAMFTVDFRLRTLTFKVFNVPELLPTALRYFVFFFGFYLLNGVANQTYRAKNLPERGTIAINSFFNIFGIALVITIQYVTFKSTGVLWQDNMALGYIVLFPILPILVFATIISRELYKKTGNVYLGSLINALIWTMVTVSCTASSFSYVLG